MRNHSIPRQARDGEQSRTILALVIIALLVGTAAEAKYSGGTGEPNNPYQISTAADMNAIGADSNDWDAHFLVICDINLADYTGTQFNIIGNYSNRFTGIFDGNDHTISNFIYECTNTNYIGIFSYVGEGGQIKNLSLENVDVNAVSGAYVGGLVGYNLGEIENCYSTGEVSGYGNVGGLAGYSYEGAISNCYATGTVSGWSSVGGLVGNNYYGTITNCYSTGGVTGGSGLVGGNYYGTITNCYSTGGVTGGSGLVGENSGTITDCYSTGGVTGSSGLVGENSGTMTDCYSTGSVTGSGSYVGGLVASNSGTINNCYSADSVTGSGSYAGGLVASNSGTITNCYSTGSVIGNYYVGGLVGKNCHGTVTNCYSTGNVSGTGDHGYVGGLAGYNAEDAIIYNCYSISNVSGTASGELHIGGLVGYDEGGGAINSFWDVNTSGYNTSAGGHGKTTAEMKMASTYIGWGGCDNNDIWTIDDGNDYPHLAWEDEPGQVIGEQHLSDYVTSGSGEPNDPYLISTGWQLNLIGAFPCEWDKNFLLVADINLADYSGTQVNIIGRPGRPFTGVFDGNDKRIWNFTWNSNGVNYIGLFGYVTDSGQVKNVGMENVDIYVVNGSYVGGLVGWDSNSTIENSYSTGNVSGSMGTSYLRDGLYGRSVGGLVGYNYYGSITNCYSTSEANGTGHHFFANEVGGLVGWNHFGTIDNCYSTGRVSGTDSYSDNTDNRYGSDAGGLVGYNWYGTINNCYSTGKVSGTTNYGGSWNCAAGLVGSNTGTITNCYSTGNVNGINGYYGNWNYAGGLVGHNDDGTIINCYSTGDVNGTVVNGLNHVGGLVGRGSEITNCYSTGDVNGTVVNNGDNYVGGLVGQGDEISNCYSTGDVNGTIVNNGDNYVGGLVGYNGGTITDCYSAGNVTGNGYYVGGLTGSGGATNSFWDVETSGQSKSGGGTPKTTAEMKTKSTFTDAGWDFVGETINGTNDYWRMCVDDVNYPLLSWQFISGDFVCPDGVDFFDFAFFANYWMDDNCSGLDDCDGADIDFSGTVGMADLKIFCQHWLEGR